MERRLILDCRAIPCKQQTISTNRTRTRVRTQATRIRRFCPDHRNPKEPEAVLFLFHAVGQEITERTEALTQSDDWSAFRSNHSLNDEARCAFITFFFIRNSFVFSVSSCWVLNRYGLALDSLSGGGCGVCGGRFGRAGGVLSREGNGCGRTEPVCCARRIFKGATVLVFDRNSETCLDKGMVSEGAMNATPQRVRWRAVRILNGCT
jgi:hypothetical protein